MEEERETMDFEQLLSENLGSTGVILKEMEVGSSERLNEAKIFDMQCKATLDMYEKTNVILEREARLDFDREKFDKELELKREIEKIRIESDERKFEKELEFKEKIEQMKYEDLKRKDKNEIAALWSKVALAGVEIASGIGLGLLYLKVNLSYGGLIGKDGKRFWDEIRRIKI